MREGATENVPNRNSSLSNKESVISIADDIQLEFCSRSIMKSSTKNSVNNKSDRREKC